MGGAVIALATLAALAAFWLLAAERRTTRIKRVRAEETAKTLAWIAESESGGAS